MSGGVQMDGGDAGGIGGAGGAGGSDPAQRCIGEPISWLRLEQLALGELADAASARRHLEKCAACATAFEEIRGDARALPALPARPKLPQLAGASGLVELPGLAKGRDASSGSRTKTPGGERRPWWQRWQRWRRWQLVPAGFALAAAVVLLVLVRARPPADPDVIGDAAAPASRIARVKGAGAIVVTWVRERDGAIAFDPADVLPGDRWKLQLTCDPGGAAWLDVVVLQRGAPSYPLPAQAIACGNAVVVPGAFRITGGAAELCAVLSDAPLDRARLAADLALRALRNDRGAVCTSLTAPSLR